MKKERIYFYLLRLKKSSPPELIYRAEQFFLVKKLKRQLKKNQNPAQAPAVDLEGIKKLRLPSLDGQIDENLVAEILAGKLFSLNSDPSAIADFEHKTRNRFFGDIQPSGQDPDIRTVWEPARLQHLVILLNTISRTQESTYKQDLRQFVKDAVFDWIHKNPFLFGPHYISVMECAMRIPVFLFCLKYLDTLKAREHRLILDTIFQHGWLISKRLSLYSSLGNHTVAECVGLIFAGAVFKNTAEGRSWLEKGYDLLKQELEHQILADGGPAEQSLNYHRFVLDLYWLAVDFLERNNLYDCSSLKQKLIPAENFLRALEYGRGHLQTIGDSDDGYAVGPGMFPNRGKPDNDTANIQSFKDSGYTVIKNNRVVLSFDHGPLGMAPLHNHGHADALSVTIALDDLLFLIDPGTYRYNGGPEWRKYFKGTRAHNTVTIDGEDQAVQETGFIWSQPYTSKLIQKVELNYGCLLKARHDGYTRLTNPVIHERTIVWFDKKNIAIKDEFNGEGFHEFELNFHFHPDVTISEGEVWFQAENQGAKIFITYLEDNKFRSFKGLERPIFGWYSPAYGIKTPCSVLSCMKKGLPREISFITAIAIDSPPDHHHLRERICQIEEQAENT
jgi:hypothetical protein